MPRSGGVLVPTRTLRESGQLQMVTSSDGQAGNTRPRVLLVANTNSRDNFPIRRIRDLPGSLLERFELAALLMADGEAFRADPDLSFPFSVLNASLVDGYGGRQKLAFEYAVERGFDAVVLVGGDAANHASGALEALLEPLFAGDAAAVFRAPAPGLLERLARRMVDRVLRRPVCSLHDGDRAYRTDALRRIPFALDADDRHIDTEILIQLDIAGLQAVEIPPDAPAPAARRPSWGHVMDAGRAAVRARLHAMNLFYERRFDCEGAERDNAQYRLKMDFDSSHVRALARIPAGSRVLDLGCAGGDFAQLLEREHGCTVTAVDREPLAAGNSASGFHLWDLDQGPPDLDYSQFDVVLMLDVIEHLRAPEIFMQELCARTAALPGLKLVFTTGNVAFATTRIGLMLGQFNYGKRGILDLTHTRLFTFSTFRRLARQAGFRVLHREGVPAPFPLATSNRLVGHGLLAMNRSLIPLVPNLAAYQILLVLSPNPSLGFLLEQAEATDEEPGQDMPSR